MKSILFNTEMVRAILDGRKTVTRRVVKPVAMGMVYEDGSPARKPPYRPGDILYMRETWATPYGGEYRYRADYKEHDIVEADRGDVSVSANLIRWKPSIHMPRKAARIFLRVTNVRVERLQDITDEQALAEGVPEDGDYPLENPVYCPKCKGEGLLGAFHPVSLGYMEVDCLYCDTPKKRFYNLWDSTIKPSDRALYGWDANPWVWVIEFERITKEEAEHG